MDDAKKDSVATSLYCRKCGARLLQDSAFCTVCGASQTGGEYASTQLLPLEPVDLGTGRLPPGRVLRQRYRLLQKVGHGGMGAVYLAQDTQLGDRLMAVKEMSMKRLAPEELLQAIEQFRSEAHLLASLHHSNLPIIYEYFSEEDRWYLVMSFIEGTTLQALLEATPEKRLPMHEAVRIAIILCNVLDYLHTHQPQIIFRDLKPANIMLTPAGQVYLIDFGIARHFKQDQTKDTTYFYSVGYAPPEQYGQSQTDPRSDIYSLGVTIHQMLSGHNPARRPFQFPPLQLIDPTIPLPLARLVSQMLEMHEQQRPASAAEVKAQLEKIPLTNSPSTARSADPLRAKMEDSEQAGHEKVTVPDIGSPWQSLVHRGSTTVGRLQIVAWLCFIALSLLISIPFGNVIRSQDSDFIIDGGYGIFLLISGIGAAIIGLPLLLLQEQPFVRRLGGGLLTVFGNLALLTLLSPTVNVCGRATDYSVEIYDNQGNALSNVLCHPFSQLGLVQYFVFIFLISILLLSVGTFCFLGKANRTGGLVFGVCLILSGIVVALIARAVIGQAYFNYDLIYLGATTWIPSSALGILSIIMAFRKRQRAKPRSYAARMS